MVFQHLLVAGMSRWLAMGWTAGVRLPDVQDCALGHNVQTRSGCSFLGLNSSVNMEAVCSSETFMSTYTSSLHYTCFLFFPCPSYSVFASVFTPFHFLYAPSTLFFSPRVLNSSIYLCSPPCCVLTITAAPSGSKTVSSVC